MHLRHSRPQTMSSDRLDALPCYDVKTYPADGPNIDSSSRLFRIAVETNLIGDGLLFWMDGFESQLLFFPFWLSTPQRPALTKKVL